MKVCQSIRAQAKLDALVGGGDEQQLPCTQRRNDFIVGSVMQACHVRLTAGANMANMKIQAG